MENKCGKCGGSGVVNTDFSYEYEECVCQLFPQKVSWVTVKPIGPPVKLMLGQTSGMDLYHSGGYIRKTHSDFPIVDYTTMITPPPSDDKSLFAETLAKLTELKNKNK